MALIAQPQMSDSDEIVVVDIPEDEQMSMVDAVLGEIGVENQEDCLCKIYRINEFGKEAHCFDTGIGSLDGIEDRLRDAYGKGDYKIKVFTPTPQGKKSIKKVVKLTLETPMEKELPPVPENNSDDIKAFMMQVMQTMQANQQAMNDLVREQNANFRESQMQQQVEMQKLIIQTMGNKPEAPNIMEQFALFKQIMPEQQNPLDMINTVMDVQNKIQESVTPAPSTPLGELSHGIDSLVKLAAQSPAKQAGLPGIKAQPPQPVKPQPLPQQPAQQMQPIQQPIQQPQQPQVIMNLSNPFVQAELRKYLNMLLVKAKEGKSPEIFAYFVLEEMPDKFMGLLQELIGDGGIDAVNRCAEIEPGVMERAEWFHEFADHIHGLLIDADEIINENQEDDSLKLSDDSSDNNQSMVDTQAQDDSSPPTEAADESNT